MNFREKEQEALHRMNENMNSMGQKVDLGWQYVKEVVLCSFDASRQVNSHLKEYFCYDCEIFRYYKQFVACTCIGFSSSGHAKC